MKERIELLIQGGGNSLARGQALTGILGYISDNLAGAVTDAQAYADVYEDLVRMESMYTNLVGQLRASLMDVSTGLIYVERGIVDKLSECEELPEQPASAADPDTGIPEMLTLISEATAFAMHQEEKL